MKSNRVRIMFGLALLVVALGAQPIFAFCEGAVLGIGTRDVFKCEQACPGDETNLRKWVRRNCPYVCCPDGSFEYSVINCDNGGTWEQYNDWLGNPHCCPNVLPYKAPGYEFMEEFPQCPQT